MRQILQGLGNFINNKKAGHSEGLKREGKKQDGVETNIFSKAKIHMQFVCICVFTHGEAKMRIV